MKKDKNHALNKKEIYIISIVILMMIILLSNTGCQQLRARMLIREGVEAYQKENYSEACPKLEEAMNLMPGNLALKRSIGFCYMAWHKAGDTSKENVQHANKAVKIFKEILAANPGDSRIRESLLTLYYNANRFQDAIAFLQEEYKKNSRDKELIKMIASLYIKDNKYKEAFTWYEKIAEIDPKDEDPWYTIGNYCWRKAYCEQNRCEDPTLPLKDRIEYIEKGLQSLQKAIEVNSNHADSYVYLNLLYREKAKWIDLNDPIKKEEDIKLADSYRDKAIQLKEAEKKKQAEIMKGASGS